MSATRLKMDARIRARRHDVMRERARRRRRLTFSVIILVVLAAAGVGIARSSLFAIIDVRVTGVQGQEAELVRRTAAIEPGNNLLSTDLRAAAARVADLPWIRDADARRIPPATLELQVTRRQPIVTVRLPEAAWLVDADGVVVAGGSQEGLVEITAPHSVVPGVGGQVRDAALRNALIAHAEMPASLRATVVGYEAPSARDLRLHLAGGVVVRFGVADQVEAKARSIALLLEQIRLQAERRTAPDEGTGSAGTGSAGTGYAVMEIDVRAPDNPVLVPAPLATEGAQG